MRKTPFNDFLPLSPFLRFLKKFFERFYYKNPSTYITQNSVFNNMLRCTVLSVVYKRWAMKQDKIVT